MSVLVDHRRAASKRIIGISTFRTIGDSLLQHLAERVALERLGKSVLVGVGNGTPRAVVGNGKRSKRLASVEAFHAGHESRVAIRVLRHDSVGVRHADRRVEGIVANPRDIAEGVAHGNREARLVVGNLRLAASVVHRRDVALSVAGKARRDRRSAVGVEERNCDWLAPLRVGERGDGLDRALAAHPARSLRETPLGVVREVAVVAEAVADARDVSALRVVAVRDEVLPLAVDDLPDLPEIGDVVAHEVVDRRLPAAEIGDGEHAVLRVVAVRGRAVRLVAKRHAAVVGVGEIAISSNARRAVNFL